MPVELDSRPADGMVRVRRIIYVLTHLSAAKIVVWFVLACLSLGILIRFFPLGGRWYSPSAHFSLEMCGAFVSVGLVYCLWVEYRVVRRRRILLAALAFAGLALSKTIHGIASLVPTSIHSIFLQPAWEFHFAWKALAALLLIAAARNGVVDDKQKTRRTGVLVIFIPLALSLLAAVVIVKLCTNLPQTQDFLFAPKVLTSGNTGFLLHALTSHWITLIAFSIAFAMFARLYMHEEDHFSERLSLCLLLLTFSQFVEVMHVGTYDTAWWFGHGYMLLGLTVLLVKLGSEFGASYADAQARIEHLEAVHYISSRLSKTLDLRVVLLTFVTDTAKMLSARFASIMLSDDVGETLATVATFGIQDTPFTTSEPRKIDGVGAGFHKGHTARAFREKQICIVDDVFTDVEFVPWRLLAQQDGYSVSVPLIYHDVVLGVVNLFFEKHVPLNDERIKLFQTLATSASVSIANAQLYDRTLRYGDAAMQNDVLLHIDQLAS